MKKQKSTVKYLSIKNVAVFLFILMIITLLLQVVFRYVLKYPLYWSGELARFLHIWIVFIGAYITAQEDGHVKLDYFKNKMKIKTKQYISIFNYLAICLILIVVIFGIFTLILKLWQSTSPVMSVPMPFVFGGALVGVLLMIMVYGGKIFNQG